MLSSAAISRQSAVEPTVISVVGTSPEVDVSQAQLPEPVALVNTAERAVEAVLDVAHRVASRHQNSVNLQFSVGGNELDVRVEMRDGEVRTTFKTDSADLRAALATEWQAVAAQPNPDRPVRLADPVFTRADAAFGAGVSGDGTSGQRGQQGHGSAESGVPVAIFRLANSGTNASSPAASQPRVDTGKSHLLHTVA